jgi:hypothetical protein
VAFEPLARQLRYPVQRTGFFEKVSRPGDDRELLFPAELLNRRLV